VKDVELIAKTIVLHMVSAVTLATAARALEHHRTSPLADALAWYLQDQAHNEAKTALSLLASNFDDVKLLMTTPINPS